MSEPNKIRKWVVEKFDGISPGLVGSGDHNNTCSFSVNEVEIVEEFLTC